MFHVKRAVRERIDTLASEWALPPAAADQLVAVLAELERERSSITTVRDQAQAVGRHLEDRLDGLRVPAVREAAEIADLGSGGGFPGLVLAIALPESHVFLVESVRRKCDFLDRATASAAIDNVTVVCDRAESWAQRELDVVTARALAPLPVLAEYAAPLLRVGGTLVAWKGEPSVEERSAGDVAAAILGLAPGEEFGPATTAATGVLITYTKVAETSDRFPRRPGMARKRPLA